MNQLLQRSRTLFLLCTLVNMVHILECMHALFRSPLSVIVRYCDAVNIVLNLAFVFLACGKHACSHFGLSVCVCVCSC